MLSHRPRRLITRAQPLIVLCVQSVVEAARAVRCVRHSGGGNAAKYVVVSHSPPRCPSLTPFHWLWRCCAPVGGGGGGGAGWHGVIVLRYGFYRRGIFKFVIHIPEAYPYVAPKVVFLSKVFHPLINYKTGELDLFPQV